MYYHNAQTKESTYIRPLPTFPIAQQAPPLPPKKKEKPAVKTPVSGTDWLRVTTNQGNIFYTHKIKKESLWTVPEEIQDAVKALEAKEQEDKLQQEKETLEESARKVQLEREQEIARVKAEVEGAVKRKAELDVPVDEVVVSKKARVGDDDEADDDDDDDSEEEEWQKEAAAQLAAEAEEEKKLREEEEKRAREEEEEAKSRESKLQLNMPERVDLSVEEGKALFKVHFIIHSIATRVFDPTFLFFQTLLREKDVNPLHPWDTSLPLFISDPRYVLLPSVAARREAFDEYCRDRARELRQSQVKREKEDPKQEFERLLNEEVTSTRTSWTDFRRKWKKDRRFYGWGRDDREREKRFREFLKTLGESTCRLLLSFRSALNFLFREEGCRSEGRS